MMADLMRHMQQYVEDEQDVISMLGQDGQDVFHRLLAGRIAYQDKHALPDSSWSSVDGVLLAAAMYLAQTSGDRFVDDLSVLSPENIGRVTMQYEPVLLSQLPCAIGKQQRVGITRRLFCPLDTFFYIALGTLSLFAGASLMASVPGTAARMGLLVPGVGLFITVLCVLTEAYETILQSRVLDAVYWLVYTLCCLWETLHYQLTQWKGGGTREAVPQPVHP